MSGGRDQGSGVGIRGQGSEVRKREIKDHFTLRGYQ